MKEKLFILIVDDNINFINRMEGLLNELDNIGRIDAASDYEKAVHLISKRTPDFLLLDINLPGRSGIEILKTIKKNGWQCEVIMVSNHTDEYYRNQCRELGARYFLDKSSEFGLVADIIGQRNSK
ncbi:MAG: response regulator [Sphingobacteriales bacterium]|nr:response regulator [Sphingobacteriales bacterium]